MTIAPVGLLLPGEGGNLRLNAALASSVVIVSRMKLYRPEGTMKYS